MCFLKRLNLVRNYKNINSAKLDGVYRSLESDKLESSGRERSERVAWTVVKCVENYEAQW